MSSTRPPSGSRSSIRLRPSTTIERRFTPRSNSPAWTRWAGCSTSPSTTSLAARCATPCRSPATSSSGIPTRPWVPARSGRSNSWSSTPSTSRRASASGRTSSRPASSRPTTSSDASSPLPRRSPTTPSESTRTPHTACGTPFGSAMRSRASATTTTRIRPGG